MTESILPPDSLERQDTRKAVPDGDVDLHTCTAEHCYYAFDTLYCSLTKAKPLSPAFPDNK